MTHELLEEFDMGQLICNHSRVVTDRGIAVCPILLDSPGAIMGVTLDEADRDFPLAYGACFTCYQYGAICTNAASSPMEG